MLFTWSSADHVCLDVRTQGAKGSDLPSDLAAFTPTINGAAIEVRICAEDPAHNYRPCTGVLGLVAWPQQVETRVDTWVETGVEVSGEHIAGRKEASVHSLRTFLCGHAAWPLLAHPVEPHTGRQTDVCLAGGAGNWGCSRARIAAACCVVSARQPSSLAGTTISLSITGLLNA